MLFKTKANDENDLCNLSSTLKFFCCHQILHCALGLVRAPVFTTGRSFCCGYPQMNTRPWQQIQAHMCGMRLSGLHRRQCTSQHV